MSDDIAKRHRWASRTGRTWHLPFPGPVEIVKRGLAFVARVKRDHCGRFANCPNECTAGCRDYEPRKSVREP